MKERLNNLQKQNVYINTGWEHYDNGSNLCFSVEFRDTNDQTGWYNDNHEFGDIGTALECAIELAEWFLEDKARIEDIDGIFNSPLAELRSKKIQEIIKMRV